jgi:hypothetical protein
MGSKQADALDLTVQPFLGLGAFLIQRELDARRAAIDRQDVNASQHQRDSFTFGDPGRDVLLRGFAQTFPAHR